MAAPETAVLNGVRAPGTTFFAMPGTALLGNSIVDEFIPIADELRQILRIDCFGTNSWTVEIIEIDWSASGTGSGRPGDIANAGPQPTVTVLRTIEPAPLVSEGTSDQLRPSGLDEEGVVTLSEVSLTYTRAELDTTAPDGGKRRYYRLTEAQGQLKPRIYGTVFDIEDFRGENPGEDLGWTVKLRVAESPEGSP